MSLDDLLRAATRAADGQKRRREQRFRNAGHEGWVERNERMLDLRSEDERGMDSCLIREQAVRGLGAEHTMLRCRLDHEHVGGSPLGFGSPGKVYRQCVYTAMCWRCGKALSGRQRRWCGMTCVKLWVTNHSWTEARAAALQRDGYACVRCGAQSGYRCDCRLFIPSHPRDGVSWRQRNRHQDEHPGHRFTYVDARLEVNHKVPRVGRGYDAGCHHHLDGLETLCHPHHVEETTRQRRERRDAWIAKRMKELGLEQQNLLE